MKKSKSPATGAKGAYMGMPKLNKHLQTPVPNIERTTRTADHRIMFGSMWDLAKKLTKGKN